MIFKSLVLFVGITSLLCGEDWLQKASERADPEAIQWVKQQLKEELASIERENLPMNPKKCSTIVSTAEPQISTYVLISFSVPEVTWISLSKEMENVGAVFVLRGLPDNSFKELSKRVQHLNKLGVNATIQIDPNLFTAYQVDRVPSFLMIDGENAFRKITGNISLAYAIEKMGER